MSCGDRCIGDATRRLHTGCRALTLGVVLLLGVQSSRAFQAPQADRVSDTVHNLSSTGPGQTRSDEVNAVCRFCHVAHGGSDMGLLFNKPDTDAVFTPYSSPTLRSQPGTPFGISRMCLACHDGTIALGDLLSDDQVWSFPPGREYLEPGFGGIEPMLRDDHPVSFRYEDALTGGNDEIRDPAALPPELHLEAGEFVGCATCHDAHDNILGSFLRRPADDAALCLDCHAPHGWDLATHQQAVRPAAWKPAASTSASSRMPVQTERSACLACHAVHFAPTHVPLLAGPAEEAGCYACHASTGPATEVESDFLQPFRHPVELTAGTHTGNEDPFAMPRHVECADCHNPHAATSIGDPMGTMAELPGIDLLGLPVDPAQTEQEVCYRCHGLEPEPEEALQRQVSGFSIREQLGPLSDSAHPVDRDNRGNSPSLLPEWSSVARIRCVDCHGGSTAQGENARPHGSPHPFVLRRFYQVGGWGSRQIEQDAALCGRCHDLDFIIRDRGPFRRHREHIKGGAIPCSSCHAPHGVPGSLEGHSYLINFDLGAVEPANSGGLFYTHDDAGRATCTLKCHGKNHENRN
ncbi:MAG: cytochrome c3 family protein [Candidatus Krumholzibacteriia bacterium]